jgi:3-phytase
MRAFISKAVIVLSSLAVSTPAALALNLVTPTIETPPVNPPGDADDPAIWLHPTDPSLSLILGTRKNTGMSVYDLNGNQIQTINPGGVRYNNVDVQYGFRVGGQTIDFAAASDRRNDTIEFFSIDPFTRQLTNITSPSNAKVFTPAGQPANGTTTAYGLALYRSPFTGKNYVFVSKRTTGTIAQLELFDDGTGKIGTRPVRLIDTLPVPQAPLSPQVEGMVADRELGFLYVGQEDVGIWKFSAEPNGSNIGTLVDATKPIGTNLTADAEGLTIYYTANGTGYLLASSQGDSTFAVYTREGNNTYLGSFQVVANGGIDSVQNSDGADVLNVPLGSAFPFGLFVTHDGNYKDQVTNGDNLTNFKYVPWENLANSFAPGLRIDTTSFDPRSPQLVPEPATAAALLGLVPLVFGILPRKRH